MDFMMGCAVILKIIKQFISYAVQFKKKVTFSHVYNEVTGEPTIMRYKTVVRKTLRV
jgi:hypothetical protein